jgi:hypothetical protein
MGTNAAPQAKSVQILQTFLVNLHYFLIHGGSNGAELDKIPIEKISFIRIEKSPFSQSRRKQQG